MAIDPVRCAPLVVLVLFGALASGCMSCLNGGNYGDGPPGPSTKSEYVSPSKQESIRKMWAAGAQEASARCDAMVRSLVEGAVFVADGERAPRAKELLGHECGPFTKQERKNFDDPLTPKPLLDANPLLCDRLKRTTPPEAFVMRYEGKALYWYLFSYEEVGDRLRMLDLYTKVPVMVPELHAACYLQVTHEAKDVGVAPIWPASGNPCWGGPTLETLDLNQTELDLCYTYRHPFRRTTKKLETDQDGR